MNAELRTLAEDPSPINAMSLIERAITQGAGIETIERLVALQEHIADKNAEQAFAAAMSCTQANMGRISADATNPQTKSAYASYAALDRVLRPIYTAEGFSLSFDTADGGADAVLVLCHVSHNEGHTRTYRISMPNDGKGAKGGDVMTKTHAQGAAMSYGMRYLLKLIFNVAIGEDDKDGNDGDEPGMKEDAFQAWMAQLRGAATKEALQDVFTEAWAAATGDKKTRQAFTVERDLRYAILRGAK